MSAHLGRLRIHHQKSPSTLRSRGPHVTSVTAMQPHLEPSGPFSRQNFHRVKLAPAPYGPMQVYNHQQGSSFNGVLVFQQDSEDSSEALQSILEVFVAGDVAFNTWMQLAPERQAQRPMVHELLWAVLQQAQSCSTEPWALLQAAITEITDAVFVGRLYFGNPETGQVLWECDCRPSDGCYLSMRAKCPFFVHKRVWQQAALPLEDTCVYKLVRTSTSPAHDGRPAPEPPSPLPPTATPAPRSSAWHHSVSAMQQSGHPGGPQEAVSQEALGGGRDGGASSNSKGRLHHHSASPYLGASPRLSMQACVLIRPDDLEAVKLLKRALTLAVAEEDFEEAVRLRDHPWMQMSQDMARLRSMGRFTDARRVEAALRRQVEAVAQTTQLAFDAFYECLP